jgi:anti-sigma B factor antagonist
MSVSMTPLPNPEYAKITIEGPLLSGTELLQAVKDALTKGYKKIVLDASGMETINSTGLGALAISYKEVVERAGGKLVLLNPNPGITEVMNITKLDTLLGIAKTQEEALKALG